jgi:UDP-glucose 4-epimerase
MNNVNSTVVPDRKALPFGGEHAGDPLMLTASSAKFDLVVVAWRHYTLDDMIKHAWAWYVR